MAVLRGMVHRILDAQNVSDNNVVIHCGGFTVACNTALQSSTDGRRMFLASWTLAVAAEEDSVYCWMLAQLLLSLEGE